MTRIVAIFTLDGRSRLIAQAAFSAKKHGGNHNARFVWDVTVLKKKILQRHHGRVALYHGRPHFHMSSQSQHAQRHMAAQCLQALAFEMSGELSEGCGSVEEEEECAVGTTNAVGRLCVLFCLFKLCQVSFLYINILWSIIQSTLRWEKSWVMLSQMWCHVSFHTWVGKTGDTRCSVRMERSTNKEGAAEIEKEE